MSDSKKPILEDVSSVDLVAELARRKKGLSSFSTFDLVDALMDRIDVEYVVNDYSSRSYGAYIEGGKVIQDYGEVVILAVKGNYSS